VDCRRAYDAARVASLLVKERAAATFEPSPFFQTRVLAALRERQAANAPFSFARLWKTAGALVGSMAASVALLAGLTFLAPAPTSGEPAASDVASVSSPSTAEDVILNQDDATDDQISYGQVLTAIYDEDEGDVR
jgi:hypothetical protein